MSTVNLYETEALMEVTGPNLRPGGVELTDRGLEFCRLRPGSRVFDIGCGLGATAAYLNETRFLNAVGMDLSVLLLQKGKRKGIRLSRVQARAEALPALSDQFDAVLCECVLSLCTHPDIVVSEIFRVLAPGGYLIATDVYAQDTTHDSHNMKSHVGRAVSVIGSVRCCLDGAVTRHEVESRIRQSGLEMLLWEDHTPLLTQLAAKLVWTHGSLKAFWSAMGGSGERLSGAGCNGKPGYYLLVAQKPIARRKEKS
jgi:arsenite methyltransferase